MLDPALLRNHTSACVRSDIYFCTSQQLTRINVFEDHNNRDATNAMTTYRFATTTRRFPTIQHQGKKKKKKNFMFPRKKKVTKTRVNAQIARKERACED